MPRWLVIWGTALVVLTNSAAVRADDAEITRQITAQLRQQQKNQGLQGFRIGVQVSDGTVTILGNVSSPQQRHLALETARRVPGVKLVVNDLQVQESERAPVAPTIAAAAYQQATVGHTANDQPPRSLPATRNMGRAPSARRRFAQPQHMAAGTRPAMAMPARSVQPVAFAHSTIPSHLPTGVLHDGEGVMHDGGGVMHGGGEMGSGGPMPAAIPSQLGGGVQQAMHDNPSMPGYAWPSYASYPNYGAVTYPKQYSATAWPYIGPFYPYPQVPLGWRKVMLQWDDGWWWLDFKSK